MQLKFKSKPRITLGLQKSVSAKHKLLTNFIHKKDPLLNEECHTNYKKCRSLLSTLMKFAPNFLYNLNKLATVFFSFFFLKKEQLKISIVQYLLFAV